jgi:hypothetical protein
MKVSHIRLSLLKPPPGIRALRPIVFYRNIFVLCYTAFECSITGFYGVARPRVRVGKSLTERQLNQVFTLGAFKLFVHGFMHGVLPTCVREKKKKDLFTGSV